jgi:hypothetical protein
MEAIKELQAIIAKAEQLLSKKEIRRIQVREAQRRFVEKNKDNDAFKEQCKAKWQNAYEEKRSKILAEREAQGIVVKRGRPPKPKQ